MHVLYLSTTMYSIEAHCLNENDQCKYAGGNDGCSSSSIGCMTQWCLVVRLEFPRTNPIAETSRIPGCHAY